MESATFNFWLAEAVSLFAKRGIFCGFLIAECVNWAIFTAGIEWELVKLNDNGLIY